MIAIEHLTLGFRDRILVSEGSARVQAGKLTALLGRNGSGKSTLLKTLSGLARPQSGKITISGKDIFSLEARELARTVSFVSTERIRINNLRCRDVVAMGRAPYTNWIGSLGKRDKALITESIEAVGMGGFEDKTMDKMSDGECQRIMIARALAQDTGVILLDEPTSFLDLPNRYELARLLGELAVNRGKCILFSTHELEIAARMCDSIMLIHDASLISGDSREIIESGKIQTVFGEVGQAAICLSHHTLSSD